MSDCKHSWQKGIGGANTPCPFCMQPVYDAAMAVWSALRGELIHPEYGGFGHEVRNEHDHTEETLDLVDELDAACRRAKEGHG